MDEMLTCTERMRKLEEQLEQSASYDDEEEEDLGSELGDTLADDLPGKVGLPSHEASSAGQQDGDLGDERSEIQGEDDEDSD